MADRHGDYHNEEQGSDHWLAAATTATAAQEGQGYDNDALSDSQHLSQREPGPHGAAAAPCSHHLGSQHDHCQQHYEDEGDRCQGQHDRSCPSSAPVSTFSSFPAYSEQHGVEQRLNPRQYEPYDGLSAEMERAEELRDERQYDDSLADGGEEGLTNDPRHFTSSDIGHLNTNDGGTLRLQDEANIDVDQATKEAELAAATDSRDSHSSDRSAPSAWCPREGDEQSDRVGERDGKEQHLSMAAAKHEDTEDPANNYDSNDERHTFHHRPGTENGNDSATSSPSSRCSGIMGLPRREGEQQEEEEEEEEVGDVDLQSQVSSEVTEPLRDPESSRGRSLADELTGVGEFEGGGEGEEEWEEGGEEEKEENQEKEEKGEKGEEEEEPSDPASLERMSLFEEMTALDQETKGEEFQEEGKEEVEEEDQSSYYPQANEFGPGKEREEDGWRGLGEGGPFGGRGEEIWEERDQQGNVAADEIIQEPFIDYGNEDKQANPTPISQRILHFLSLFIVTHPVPPHEIINNPLQYTGLRLQLRAHHQNYLKVALTVLCIPLTYVFFYHFPQNLVTSLIAHDEHKGDPDVLKKWVRGQYRREMETGLGVSRNALEVLIKHHTRWVMFEVAIGLLAGLAVGIGGLALVFIVIGLFGVETEVFVWMGIIGSGNVSGTVLVDTGVSHHLPGPVAAPIRGGDGAGRGGNIMLSSPDMASRLCIDLLLNQPPLLATTATASLLLYQAWSLSTLNFHLPPRDALNEAFQLAIEATPARSSPSFSLSNDFDFRANAEKSSNPLQSLANEYLIREERGRKRRSVLLDNGGVEGEIFGMLLSPGSSRSSLPVVRGERELDEEGSNNDIDIWECCVPCVLEALRLVRVVVRREEEEGGVRGVR
ncbi:Hypothetical predicted protein [Lecanosticta acicola]|uniref:Uncharacterized protein n=1 Tax=Lecanosticta acicola TaxID=111012 RepID=A0AAI8Z5K9_9PEZI|nr:Hypothetical predicted protein [Lecanosticta acicola]